MLKMAEIKDLDNKAIASKISDLKKELFDVKFQKGTSGIEKPHLLKNLKKDIARLGTALNLKK